MVCARFARVISSRLARPFFSLRSAWRVMLAALGVALLCILALLGLGSRFARETISSRFARGRSPLQPPSPRLAHHQPIHRPPPLLAPRRIRLLCPFTRDVLVVCRFGEIELVPFYVEALHEVSDGSEGRERGEVPWLEVEACLREHLDFCFDLRGVIG